MKNGEKNRERISWEILTPLLLFSYLRNIYNIAFHYLQKSMLNSFPWYITAYTNITPGFSDLISLVDIDYSFLTSLYILATFKVQFEKDTFYIFSDVSCVRAVV